MLIHREALELAKNAATFVDGVPFTISCVRVGEDGSVTVTDVDAALGATPDVDSVSGDLVGTP